MIKVTNILCKAETIMLLNQKIANVFNDIAYGPKNLSNAFINNAFGLGYLTASCLTSQIPMPMSEDECTVKTVHLFFDKACIREIDEDEDKVNYTTYKNILVSASFEVSMEKPKEKNGLPVFNNKCSLKIFAGEQTAVKSELVEAMLIINDNN